MDEKKQYIMDRVYMCPVSGCWIWALARRRRANLEYGAASKNGRVYAAHRMAYEVFKGAIPDGLQIDHLCKVTLCCNPQHLEAVTMAENIRRSDAALNAGKHYSSKTHCPSGHEYDQDNTYIFTRYRNGVPSTQRTCKKCHLKHNAKYYASKRLK